MGVETSFSRGLSKELKTSITPTSSNSQLQFIKYAKLHPLRPSRQLHPFHLYQTSIDDDIYDDTPDNNSISTSSSTSNSDDPIIDLQTLLKITEIAPTGGVAKLMIQSGSVKLNGLVEKRRSKKLLSTDKVEVEGVEVDVGKEVNERSYVWKRKEKTVKESNQQEGKKKNKVEEEKLFKGEFRSEEWREERKKKKYERKLKNKKGDKKTLKLSFNTSLSTRTPTDDEIKLIESDLLKRQVHKELREFDSADDIRVYMQLDHKVEINDDDGQWWIGN